jgi:FixJ family two-component response regulator
MEVSVANVCVVDDDAPLRRAMQRLLKASGYGVETFGSAEEFLAARHVPPPDCLVLDIRLGGINGFQLYDRLRAEGLSIPTVFITGHDDVGLREQARKVGAAGYVRKPFDEQSLVTAIEAALAR